MRWYALWAFQGAVQGAGWSFEGWFGSPLSLAHANYQAALIAQAMQTDMRRAFPGAVVVAMPR